MSAELGLFPLSSVVILPLACDSEGLGGIGSQCEFRVIRDDLLNVLLLLQLLEYHRVNLLLGGTGKVILDLLGQLDALFLHGMLLQATVLVQIHSELLRWAIVTALLDDLLSQLLGLGLHVLCFLLEITMYMAGQRALDRYIPAIIV